MVETLCKIEQGQLKGQENVDSAGAKFLSFCGIPYAKSPVGNLRFQAPQPPEKWSGVRDATKEGNPCIAPALAPGSELLAQLPAGSEDCLFLNVFTKKLNDSKPVMVFIHGGGFISGSNLRAMCGPEYLITEDIVLVTINYRLGALGFLRVDDPSLGVTGNAGLKDQVQALKWVQKNIKHFGGDPSNVTIFGSSAGAASVHYLVLSPLARGLFHRAILQSGSALCPWARGKSCFKELAKLCGCEETESRKIIEFLQVVPVQTLIEAQGKLEETLNPETQRNFAPFVEPNGEGAFISEEPVEILKSGRYNQVPLIFGYTADEGFIELGGEAVGFKPRLTKFVPYYFGYSTTSDEYKELKQKICEFYFNKGKFDIDEKKSLVKIFTDTAFLRAIWESVKYHTQTSHQPVYLYRMSLDAKLNFVKGFCQIKDKGTSHGDDLGYLFKIIHMAAEPGSLEEISIKRFVKMWTNFATHGNPIPEQDKLLNSKWKPATKKEINVLDIGEKLETGKPPEEKRMQFWDEVCKGRKITY